MSDGLNEAADDGVGSGLSESGRGPYDVEEVLVDISDSKTLISLAEDHLRDVSNILSDVQEHCAQNDGTATQSFAELVDMVDDTVSRALGYIVAAIDRLDYLEASLGIAQTDGEVCEPITNADGAFEQMEAIKYAIIEETSVSMQAQANVGAQTLMKLFQ
jgi:flagellin-like hook-associated protein FlgL